jgi:hypothetical protein
MKRHEAISCLKKIQKACSNMSPDAVALVDSKPDNNLSVGYQIHITGTLDQYTKKKIGAITSKNQLAMHEDNEKIIIYKPVNQPTPQVSLSN